MVGRPPVDLFLDDAPLHAQAARGSRTVPFAGGQLRVLGPVELVLCKALSDRPKDWDDIAAVVQAGGLDTDAVRHGLVELLGADDPRVARLGRTLQLTAVRAGRPGRRGLSPCAGNGGRAAARTSS